jgi:ornithine carbamoyltransferase
MTNLSLPQKVKISDHILFQEIAEEFVLLNMETEKYYGLDEVGAKVWEILKEEEETDKLINMLLMEYNVDEQTLRNHIAILFESMKSENILIY